MKQNQIKLGNIHVSTFELPPAGFNPLTASNEQLLRHGLMRRPDPKKEPKFYEIWESIYKKKLTYIVPTFKILPKQRHGQKPEVKKQDAEVDASVNWSGVVVPAAKKNPFIGVIGSWTVPNPNPPPGTCGPDNGYNSYHSAAWVGIDGGTGAKRNLLQAGTFQDVVCLPLRFGTPTNISAWWAWFPDYSVGIDNLAVSAGDYMNCAIYATSTTTARIIMTNISQSQQCSFTVSAPGDFFLRANEAEWIMERYEINNTITQLADYGVIYFDAAVALTADFSLVNAGTGNPMLMFDDNLNFISVPKIETQDLIKITYVPPPNS